MGAFHRFPGKPAIYANGTQRGDLYEARADLKLNDNWRGHVVGEYLTPGDFYAGGDAGWFFRVEAIYSFKRVVRAVALGGRLAVRSALRFPPCRGGRSSPQPHRRVRRA